MSMNFLLGLFKSNNNKIEMEKDKFIKELMSSKEPVLVDVYATWCGPCKSQKPIIEEFKTKHPNVRVELIDIDVHTKFTEIMNIRSIPTLLFIKDNDVVWRKSGLCNLETLEEGLQIAIDTITKN